MQRLEAAHDRIREMEANQPPVVDEAVIRKALDECDVPLAYQSAIIAALTAALRGSGVQAGVTDEVVERAVSIVFPRMTAHPSDYERMRAALEAIWPRQAQQDAVAYWAAVADNGELVVAYPANDGNNGETARTECNQYINDALLNDRAAFRLVRLFTHAARPQQASLPIDHPSVAIGSWLSAALDDPKACDEFKRDIRAWFDAGQPTVQQASVQDGWIEAYAAFKGAFDTPLAWRRDDSEYARDARKRLREFNEAMLAAAPKPDGE